MGMGLVLHPPILPTTGGASFFFGCGSAALHCYVGKLCIFGKISCARKTSFASRVSSPSPFLRYLRLLLLILPFAPFDVRRSMLDVRCFFSFTLFGCGFAALRPCGFAFKYFRAFAVNLVSTPLRHLRSLLLKNPLFFVFSPPSAFICSSAVELPFPLPNART